MAMTSDELSEYTTSDTALAAALITAGHNLLGLRAEDAQKVSFALRPTESLLRTLEEYRTGQLLLPAAQLLQEFRLCKSRVFEFRRQIEVGGHGSS